MWRRKKNARPKYKPSVSYGRPRDVVRRRPPRSKFVTVPERLFGTDRANLSLEGLRPGPQELKFVSGMAYGYYSVGARYLLCNGLQMGSAMYERIGDTVRMRALDARVVVTPRIEALAIPTRTSIFRMLIVYDKFANGTGMANMEYILDSSTEPKDGLGYSMALYNMTFRNRFDILYDETQALGCSQQPTGAQPAPLLFNAKLALDLPVYYTGNDNGPGAIGSGCLYVIVVSNFSDTEEARPYGPLVQMNSRMHFEDDSS